MASIEFYYRKMQADGTSAAITGATCQVEVTRIADGYFYDTATDAFVASGQTNPSSGGTAEISEVVDGLFVWDATTTTASWDNGAYSLYIYCTKTDEGEKGSVVPWTVYNGVTAGAAPSSPAAPSTCRLYVYLNDTPSSAPSSTVKYRGEAYTSTNVILSTLTPTYNNSTGLWYVDALQGSTVSVDIPTYGLHMTGVTPDVTTQALPTWRVSR